MSGLDFLLFFVALIVPYKAPTPFPSGAVRVQPPAIYRKWWALTEQCVGRKASFDAVSWYVVPGVETIPGTDRRVGEWFPEGNRIVMGGRVQGFGDLVRHEMLHAILGPEAEVHPRDAFVARCGGVVECDDQCDLDAGEPPSVPIDARPEPPSALRIVTSVDPVRPDSATWDGYFMMRVTATNPADYPIVVRLASARDDGPSVSFSYRIEGGGRKFTYDARAYEPEVTRFAPGETKQFIFDLRIDRGSYRYDLPPGTWSFHGAYGGVWSASAPTVTVGR